MKLRTQMAAAVAAIVIAVVAALGITAHLDWQRALTDSLLAEFEDNLAREKLRIENVLTGASTDLLFLADTPPVGGMARARAGGGFDEVGQSSFGQWVERLQIIFSVMLANKSQYFQMRYLDVAGNEVVRVDAINGEPRVVTGTALDNKKDLDFFKEVMQLPPESVYVSPLDLYKESGRVVTPHRPTVRVATPVFTAAGERHGMVVANLHGSAITDLVLSKVGAEFLVDQDGWFLSHADASRTLGFDRGTDYRLEKELPNLAARVTRSERAVRVVSADENVDGTERIQGLLRIDYAPTDRDRFWALAYDVPTDTVFAPARALRDKLALVGLVVALAGTLLGYAWAGRVSRPLEQLATVAGRVANGDLQVHLAATDRRDEVGDLVRSFEAMLGSLRGLTGDIREAVHQLSTSSNEIVASATELAASSSQTASAVGQTTSTLEQVRQTSEGASARAAEVADGAQRVAEVSDSGLEAVEATNDEMDRIREQMESLSASLLVLNEHAQAIDEIVASVDDLAEQSNLLAVNAAVEAAKAGEHGRGFAVVAQEVRSLAEQSKESTTRVRAILREIQRAAGKSVMAADESARAVEAGVQRSRGAGDAIGQLSESVREAAQAARQITASTREQTAGIEQIVIAMESVRDASEQNASATREFESAAHDLNSLGERLSALTRRFSAAESVFDAAGREAATAAGGDRQRDGDSAKPWRAQ